MYKWERMLAIPLSLLQVKIQSTHPAVDPWLKYWRIVINVEKSAQITFTLRRAVCPPVTLNGLTMPVRETVKYLGVHLDRRLTWKPHIKAKQTQLKQS